VDATGIHFLDDLVDELKEQEIHVVLGNPSLQVRSMPAWGLNKLLLSVQHFLVCCELRACSSLLLCLTLHCCFLPFLRRC
jgi:uncharacterized protein with von Willebrand factor type A (vWA) domain